MIYDKIIEGQYVDLRSAEVSDAEFTLAIRQDPEFVKYLPEINISIEQQRAWISKQREKQGDYFFIVTDKKGESIGTISIYDIVENHAEAGRLTMRGNAFQSIEAQMLSFRFGFYVLGLDSIVSFIFSDNDRALRFTQQFGGKLHAPELKNGRMECMATNSKEDFMECEKKLVKMLYRVR